MNFEKEYGYHHDVSPISELLRVVKTKTPEEMYKYDTYLIAAKGCLGDCRLMATDGRRMVVVRLPSGTCIGDGLYVLTDDGYYLPFDGRYLDCQKIIDMAQDYPHVYSCNVVVESFMTVSGMILGKIIEKGCNADLDLYMPVINVFTQFDVTRAQLFMSDTDPGEKPFRIEIEAEEVRSISYYQMPITRC
jgi:hypothetical protein